MTHSLALQGSPAGRPGFPAPGFIKSLGSKIPDRKTCLERLRNRWPDILYGVLVGVIFWHGATLRLRIPQTPLVDADSWGYLAPGFSKLTGGYFAHTFGRNFVYPGFVFTLLCVWGNFEALAVAQHCIGLLTGVVLLFTWNVLADCRKVSLRGRVAVRFGGLLLVASYLHRRAPIIMEHTVRPEAVFPFFLGLSFWLNFRALRGWRTREAGRGSAWYLAVNLVVTCIGWSLKPSMGLGLVAANLPLFYWLWRGRDSAWRKAVIIGAAAVVVIVGLWWPEKLLARDDRVSRIFLPTMLFTIHADMIHEQIVEDLRRGDTAPYPGAWLVAFNQELEHSLRDARITRVPGWRALGFNADYLIYRHSVFEPFFPPGQETAEAAFCQRYYWRTWRHRPGEMLSKIFRQLGLVYHFRTFNFRQWRSWNVEDYAGQNQPAMAEDYRKSLKEAGSAMLYPRFTRSVYGTAYLQKLDALSHSKAMFAQDPWVGDLNFLFDVLNLPLLIVGGIGGILLWRQHRETHAVLVGCVALCAGVNFAMYLTIAIAHGLGFERYVENQRLLTVLTECAAVLLPLQWLTSANAPDPAANTPPAEAAGL